MDRRVILAAGHGGGDAGAVARGRAEAAEAIDIVNRTAAKLRKDSRIKVFVVPHTLDLGAEIAWINERFPGHEDGYCAEIHKNSGGGTGVEAWYLTGSQTGAAKAAVMVKELSRASRLTNRGVKPDVQNRHKSLAWVRQTKPWAGLFECGFIDRDPFNNDAYAEGLFRGFLALYGLKDQVAQIYRVVRQHGTQIGAFRVRSNAWRAFLEVDGDGAIFSREGRDVTAEFVEEFGRRWPGGAKPAPEAAPPPADREAKDRSVDTPEIVHDDPVSNVPEPELLPEDESEEVEQTAATEPGRA
jgi:N-acetylmuramoyl-L-alanine amidase